MAQMIQDTREITLGVYVTGSETNATYGISLKTGKGNYKFMFGTTIGKNAAALTALKAMIVENIKAKGMMIGLCTNSEWLIKELTGGFRAKTPVERLAEYGQETMNLFNAVIKELKDREDKLVLTDDELAIELARTAAYYELHAQKAAKEAAAIASSEEELEAIEA